MQEGSRDGQGDGPPWSKAGRVGLGQVKEGPRSGSFGLWGAREGRGAGKRHPEMGRVCQREGRWSVLRGWGGPRGGDVRAAAAAGIGTGDLQRKSHQDLGSGRRPDTGGKGRSRMTPGRGAALTESRSASGRERLDVRVPLSPLPASGPHLGRWG